MSVENTQDIKAQLHESLDNYKASKGEFSSYYPGMNILVSILYKAQLEEVLNHLAKENVSVAKSFELYLETIVINMHTKAKKYKQSIYFNDGNIKDIENQGYTIPFYFDEKKKVYVLLGIVNSYVATQ